MKRRIISQGDRTAWAKFGGQRHHGILRKLLVDLVSQMHPENTVV